MKTTIKSGRIALDDECKNITEEILASLQRRGPLQINPSKLVCWIIKNFKNDILNEKVMDSLVEDHLNKRACIQDLLKSSNSDDDLLASLQEIMVRLSSSTKGVKKEAKKSKKLTKIDAKNVNENHDLDVDFSRENS